MKLDKIRAKAHYWAVYDEPTRLGEVRGRDKNEALKNAQSKYSNVTKVKKIKTS